LNFRNQPGVIPLSRKERSQEPQPLPGRGKGMLTVLADDEEHFQDLAEYV
jgi:hypothetical protein